MKMRSSQKKVTYTISMLIGILFMFLFLACARQDVFHSDIFVIIRYDDYSMLSPKVLEEQLIDLFEKNGIRATFAVIPCISENVKDPSNQGVVCLGLAKGEILRDAVKNNIIDVALHGYSHQASTKVWPFSEFVGLPVQKQIEKISKGKDILDQVINKPIHVFVPPWNRYDLNTIAALEQLGFTIISSSPLVGPGDKEAKLKFLPATIDIKDLQNSLTSARRSHNTQPVIVCVLHPYDFKEADKERGSLNVEDLRKILQWLRSQDDVKIISLEQALTIIDDLGNDRYVLNRTNYRILELIPSSLRYLVPCSGIYVSSDTSCKSPIYFVLILYVTLCIISAVFAYVGYRLFFIKYPRILDSVRLGLPAFFVIISAFALRHGDLSIKAALIITSVFGFCLGIWISHIIKKNQLRQSILKKSK